MSLIFSFNVCVVKLNSKLSFFLWNECQDRFEKSAKGNRMTIGFNSNFILSRFKKLFCLFMQI